MLLICACARQVVSWRQRSRRPWRPAGDVAGPADGLRGGLPGPALLLRGRWGRGGLGEGWRTARVLSNRERVPRKPARAEFSPAVGAGPLTVSLCSR